MNQTTIGNQNFIAQSTEEKVASLADLFATKKLANNNAPAVPAIKIVHFDQDNKCSSCNILPLSVFPI